MTERTGAILFYSQSGHTRIAAEYLAEKTGGDLIAWTCNRYRVPVLKVVRAILDVMREARPRGATPLPDLSSRGWLVLAGPIWASQPAAPLATLLEDTRGFPGPAALLLTGYQKEWPTAAFSACERIRGKPFAAELHLPNSIEGKFEFDRRIAQFVSELGLAPADAAE